LGVFLALDEVEFVLQNGERGQPARGGNVMHGCEPLGVVVRSADLAHQPLADQCVEPLHDLIDRRPGLVAVRVVEVDIVRLEPLERLFELPGHLAGRQVARLAEHAGLGGDAHLGSYAAACEPRAGHRLAFAADVAGYPDRVALRRVDHSAAVFVESVEDREAGVLVGGVAEHVAAEHQRDSGNGPMVSYANFSRMASSAMAASAAPAPLLSCFGSARTIACASFSTVRMPLPTARPSIVSAMIPRADSPATISKW